MGNPPSPLIPHTPAIAPPVSPRAPKPPAPAPPPLPASKPHRTTVHRSALPAHSSPATPPEPDTPAKKSFTTRNATGSVGVGVVIAAVLATFWQQAQLEAIRSRLALNLDIPREQVTPALVQEYLKHGYEINNEAALDMVALRKAFIKRNLFGAGIIGSGLVTGLLTALLHNRAIAAAR